MAARAKPRPPALLTAIKGCVGVVQLHAEGEGDAVVTGLHVFPATRAGRADARSLFARLVREDEAGDPEAGAAPMPDREIARLFARDKGYSSGSYLVRVLTTEG